MEVQKMDLKIRQLKFNDIYDAAKILKNIKVELTEEELTRVSNDGIKAGITVIKNIVAESKEAKEEINSFLGGLFGITGEEFGELNMVQTAKCIKQLKELEGISGFFDAVGQLMS